MEAVIGSTLSVSPVPGVRTGTARIVTAGAAATISPGLAATISPGAAATISPGPAPPPSVNPMSSYISRTHRPLSAGR
ncbi:MAG: hypothetical protein H6Q29_1570 [Bacteroidetes bacterium]|nr:hypothetical protein [Bacteroidota bacterium]